MSLLPTVLHVPRRPGGRPRRGGDRRAARAARSAARGAGSRAAVARLIDLLLIVAIRAWQRRRDAVVAGRAARPGRRARAGAPARAARASRGRSRALAREVHLSARDARAALRRGGRRAAARLSRRLADGPRRAPAAELDRTRSRRSRARSATARSTRSTARSRAIAGSRPAATVAVVCLRDGGHAEDHRPRGRRDRPGAARAVRAGARRRAARASSSSSTTTTSRSRSGARPDNEIVHEAARAMREAGFGLKAATITPEGKDDVGSPEPDPARGGRRQGDRAHRAADPGRRRARSRASITRSPSCGWPSTTPTAPSSGARATATRGRVPDGEDHARRPAARSPSTRSAPPSGSAREGLRRAEVDGLAGLRGDAQGGDGRRRGPPPGRHVPAGADRRAVRGPDLRRRRLTARDPRTESRRRLPVAISCCRCSARSRARSRCC